VQRRRRERATEPVLAAADRKGPPLPPYPPRGVQSRLEVDTRGLFQKCIDLEHRWHAGDLAGCRAIVGGLAREVAEAVSPEQQERNRDAVVLCQADSLLVRLLSASLQDVPRPRASSSAPSPSAEQPRGIGAYAREDTSRGHCSVGTSSRRPYPQQFQGGLQT